MGIVDSLNAAGFKKEKSVEGEYVPLEGVYKVQFVKADVVKSQKTGEDQLQAEFKVTETLKGKESNSKYNEFRKYLSLGAEAADKKKGVAWLINALFTAEVEVSTESDEAMIQGIQGALGATLYFKAWGWKPEDGEKAFQQFSVLKESVALKQADKNRPF